MLKLGQSGIVSAISKRKGERMTRTQVNVATSLVVGFLVVVAGVVGRWVVNSHKPPQIAATAPPKPPERRGPVFNKPMSPPAVPARDGQQVASAPAPAPVDLPPKLKDGVRMYANIHWVGDKRLQVQFLGPHLGVIPGKGYCKLMPLVVPDKARPFVSTEGRWISTDPPIYELWHRQGAKLPNDFRAVYVRNGTWWFIDFDRSYADGDQIVVERPGESGKPYIRADAKLPAKK